MSDGAPASGDKMGKPVSRVHITYDVDYGEGIEKRELPFVLGVFADLAGDPETPPPRLRERRFFEVSVDNFDAFLATVSPRIVLTVQNRLTDDEDIRLRVDLRFRGMQDFDPGQVALQIPALEHMLGIRRDLDSLRSALHAKDRLNEVVREVLVNLRTGNSESLRQEIERIAQSGLLGNLEEEKEAARRSLETFFGDSGDRTLIASHDVEAILTSRIASIDDRLSAQLNEVVHHPDFQRLEASWRGLEYLVNRTECSVQLKIRVLVASKKELYRDFDRVAEFDQSSVFKKVYEEEYGTFGGQPFTVLIGDYEFGRQVSDVRFLQSLACVASAAAAPFIGGAHPSMFYFDNFTELSNPRDLSRVFDQSTYSAWKAFRQSEDARFVGLVLPRILLRLPYGRQGQHTEVFNYEEGVDGSEHSKYLWGNAVWAFAARLTAAFARYGWYSAVSGVERGGLVTGLPTHTFITDEGERITQWPTEIAISDRRRGELETLGFIPLCQEKGTNRAVFFSARSCSRPAQFVTDRETAGASEAADLENVFAASRFAHYVGCMLRDKHGTLRSREELSRYLNSWIAAYVSLDELAGTEERARLPLREGRIEVQETPGRPGVYTTVVYAKPHFQVGDLSESLRLPAPTGKAGLLR